MIIFGTHETMPGRFDPGIFPGIRTLAIFNLSSPLQLERDCMLMNLLPNPLPTQEVLDSGEKDFDIWYMNYILTNDAVFLDLMKIMYLIYENSDILIYILVGRDLYRDAITESLIKFIQQRYHYNCNFINTLEDVPFCKESSLDIIGVYNFDIDKERYVSLLERMM